MNEICNLIYAHGVTSRYIAFHFAELVFGVVCWFAGRNNTAQCAKNCSVARSSGHAAHSFLVGRVGDRAILLYHTLLEVIRRAHLSRFSVLRAIW